jgi:hypothetical protein
LQKEGIVMKKFKKITSILLCTIILLNEFSFALSTATYATSEKIAKVATEKSNEETKKNEESYWSTTNAPIFYGATKITLKKGIIDKFDVLDTRFRIFAKDFEDGDLTPNITYTGEVNVNKVGTYSIIYKVKDSHNNESTITVPVIVTDDEDTKINVERTLFTIPSTWNMSMAGFSRCNNGDRQILGIYVPNGESLKAKIISSDNDISVNFLKNDSNQESSQTIKNNGEWFTLQNTVEEENTGGSVPVFVSTVLSKEKTDLTKTFKIELEYDTNIKELNYYHYKDDENAFRAKWKTDQNTYGVVENEVLTIILPFTDLDKTTNYYSKGFKSLDQFLEYYQKVVDKMDEYIGLELNPEKLTDQNVRTRYLIKANAHGAGAAYYNGNHVATNSTSVASFFEMNWGGLHEIAHGYQGYFGKGVMNLGEVANNIIGHYIQTDTSIFFHGGDWLGKLPNIEDSKNTARFKEGYSFTSDSNLDVKLYMLINLFDTFEGANTYAKMFSWYREKLNDGTLSTNKEANQDIYVLAIADLYNVNIIPYMEAWSLTISDSVKEEVYSENYPLYGILKDTVSDDALNTVMNGEGITAKYSVVSSDIFTKYNITGTLNLNISIDNLDKIKGKNILIKNGTEIVKKITIDSLNMTISDLPAGYYTLQMPIVTGYSQEYMYVQIKDNEKNNYTYKYLNNEDNSYDNSYSVILKGYYDTYGYKLTFTNNFKKATISFGGAGYININKASVTIYDKNGNKISSEEKGYDDKGNLVDGGIYFNFNKGSYDINIESGYVIEITHSNATKKVVWTNNLTNSQVNELTPQSTTTRYVVTDNGIKLENMSDGESQNISYKYLKEYLMNIIEEYKKTVTEDELNNRFIKIESKSKVINAYNNLRAEDQTDYAELITKIKQGGIPTITVLKEKLEYAKEEKLDLYSFISAIDNEDGKIDINDKTTNIETTLNTTKPGNYDVIYKVSDSDGNIAQHTLQITITGNEDITEDNKNNTSSEDKSEETKKDNTNNANSGNVTEDTKKDDTSNANSENVTEDTKKDNTNNTNSGNVAEDTKKNNTSNTNSGNITEDTKKDDSNIINSENVTEDTKKDNTSNINSENVTETSKTNNTSSSKDSDAEKLPFTGENNIGKNFVIISLIIIFSALAIFNLVKLIKQHYHLKNNKI